MIKYLFTQRLGEVDVRVLFDTIKDVQVHIGKIIGNPFTKPATYKVFEVYIGKKLNLEIDRKTTIDTRISITQK